MNSNNDTPSIMQIALLAEATSFNSADVERILKSKTGDSNLSVVGGQDDQGSLIVQWGNANFAVLYIDQPAPKETFDTAVRSTSGLKNGANIVANHKAHLIVSPLSPPREPGQAIVNGIGVMSLTDMLLEDQAQPLGYFWSSAETLVGADQYKSALAKASTAMTKQANREPNAGYDLPATYWVGYRLFKAKQPGLIGATTKGFSLYFGFEVELAPEQREPASIAASLYSIVGYVFANGPILKDSETIEVRPREAYRISMQRLPGQAFDRVILKMETK